MATLKGVIRRAEAGNRRPSDIFRLQAGQHLAYEAILQEGNSVEVEAFQRVVRKIASRSQGCLILPLTIAYFTFYGLACAFHEDITNVFFLESAIRHPVQQMFASDGSTSGSPLESTDTLWTTLQDELIPFLFPQTNIYDEKLPVEEWNRVGLYSQLQSLVRIGQTRKGDPSSFGRPYSAGGCSTLNRDSLDACPDFLRRYIATDMGFSLNLLPGNASDRRLRYADSHLSNNLPSVDDKEEGKHFSFWLWPNMETAHLKQVLQYFRDREWIDADTEAVEIEFYLLNCELGRPRVVQGKLRFMFSEGESIHYQLVVSTIFLELFAGIGHVFVDLAWFSILVSTSLWRLFLLWRDYKRRLVWHHMSTLFNVWESVIALFGWGNCIGFYVTWTLMSDVSDALKVVRRDAALVSLNVHEDFFKHASDAADRLNLFRIFVAWYLIVLVFKFFVSFSAQPRLAVVTTTLRYTLTDLVHFLIIFFPALLAYVVSGNLLFGRRVEEFSTLQASLGTTLRIIFESEYDWQVLAAEHYWTTALWVWSLVLLIVLLMMNMVLAIILDVHHSAHNRASSGETLLATVVNFAHCVRDLRSWVPNPRIEAWVQEEGDSLVGTSVTREKLKEQFPTMPAKQVDILMNSSQAEMTFEAKQLVTLEKALKVAGSLKLSVDRFVPHLEGLKTAQENPLNLYAAPKLHHPRLVLMQEEPQANSPESPARPLSARRSKPRSKGRRTGSPQNRTGPLDTQNTGSPGSRTGPLGEQQRPTLSPASDQVCSPKHSSSPPEHSRSNLSRPEHSRSNLSPPPEHSRSNLSPPEHSRSNLVPPDVAERSGSESESATSAADDLVRHPSSDVLTSGKEPLLLSPEDFDASAAALSRLQAEQQPEWLQDTMSLLETQRKTLRWLSFYVREMHWHIQHSHGTAMRARAESGSPSDNGSDPIAEPMQQPGSAIASPG